MINTTVMKDASEIVHYDNPNIPLYVKKALLSAYPNMEALPHWHDDIEYIQPLKGHMDYYINDKKLRIEEGDALLVNSRQMHYGFSETKRECEFICVLFKPQLLSPNPEIKSKYITPVADSMNLTHYYLHNEIPEQTVIIEFFSEIFRINTLHADGFELNIIGHLYQVWFHLFRLLQPVLDAADALPDRDLSVQREMVDYIYKNYAARLSLEKIAQSGGVCRSKCCQIFKKYLNKTPIDFLNTYRLEVSMNLLCDTTLSITEIAYSCGFSSPSYYTELFRQYKGCTPTSYREQLPAESVTA